jgi:hypothetical protein
MSGTIEKNVNELANKILKTSSRRQPAAFER